MTSFKGQFPWCHKVTLREKIHKEDSLFLNASSSAGLQLLSQSDPDVLTWEEAYRGLVFPGSCLKMGVKEAARKRCPSSSSSSSWEQIKHLIERASRSNWLPSVLSKSSFQHQSDCVWASHWCSCSLKNYKQQATGDIRKSTETLI